MPPPIQAAECLAILASCFNYLIQQTPPFLGQKDDWLQSSEEMLTISPEDTPRQSRYSWPLKRLEIPRPFSRKDETKTYLEWLQGPFDEGDEACEVDDDGELDEDGGEEEEDQLDSPPVSIPSPTASVASIYLRVLHLQISQGLLRIDAVPWRDTDSSLCRLSA